MLEILLLLALFPTKIVQIRAYFMLIRIRDEDVPKSNLEGGLANKMELPDILQGLVLASSGERGLALTATLILSMVDEIWS